MNFISNFLYTFFTLGGELVWWQLHLDLYLHCSVDSLAGLCSGGVSAGELNEQLDLITNVHSHQTANQQVSRTGMLIIKSCFLLFHLLWYTFSNDYNHLGPWECFEFA